MSSNSTQSVFRETETLKLDIVCELDVESLRKTKMENVLQKVILPTKYLTRNRRVRTHFQFPKCKGAKFFFQEYKRRKFTPYGRKTHCSSHFYAFFVELEERVQSSIGFENVTFRLMNLYGIS